VAQLIAGIDAFQQDGKFDKSRYEAALASRNMNPLTFEARLHEDLIRQQMRDAYAQNGYASNSVVDNIVRLNEQQRTISVSVIPSSLSWRGASHRRCGAGLLQTDQKEFQLPEQARVEYVKFSADALQPRRT